MKSRTNCTADKSEGNEDEKAAWRAPIYSNAGERNDVWRIGGNRPRVTGSARHVKDGTTSTATGSGAFLTTVVLVAGNTATAPPLNHRAYAEEAENEMATAGLVLICAASASAQHFCEI